MPIDPLRQALTQLPKLAWLEAGVLGLTAPFFLFPERFPLFTLIGCLLLGTTWLLFGLLAKRPFPVTPLNLPLLLITFGTAVGALVTADPELTLPKLTGLLLAFATVRWLFTYLPQLTNFTLPLLVFIGCALGMTLYGLLNISWLVKIPVIQPLIDRLPFGSDSGGVHTNQLAGTLLLFSFLCLWWGFDLWRQRRRLASLLSLATFLLCAAIMLLTQSRGGWIGFVAGLGGGVWLYAFCLPRRQALAQLRWLLPLLGVALFAAAIPIIGPERIQAAWEAPPADTAIGNLNSIGFRQEVWRWAGLASQDFFFTGTGLGTFREVARRLYPLNVRPDFDIAHAHNVFLQIWLDIGLFGLIGYLALLGQVFWLGMRTAIHAPTHRLLIIGLLSSLLGFHLFGLADTLALGSKTGLLFWINIGLVVALFLSSAPRPPTETKPA